MPGLKHHQITSKYKRRWCSPWNRGWVFQSRIFQNFLGQIKNSSIKRCQIYFFIFSTTLAFNQLAHFRSENLKRINFPALWLSFEFSENYRAQDIAILPYNIEKGGLGLNRQKFWFCTNIKCQDCRLLHWKSNCLAKPQVL